MASAIHPMNDIYDEEFHRYIMMTKMLLDKITSPSDRGIIQKWVGRLKGLKSKDPSVKKNRNCFFKYMLEIIQKHVQLPPEGMGYPQINDWKKAGGALKPQHFMSRWSGDKKVYVAAKPIPGQGVLVYMAVSSDVNQGWDLPPPKNSIACKLDKKAV